MHIVCDTHNSSLGDESVNFENIIKPLENMQEYRHLIESIKSNVRVVEAHGISDTQKALFAAAINKQFGKSVVIVTHNELAARKIYEDIYYFSRELADIFPAGEMIFHKIDARSNEIRQQRLKVIADVLGKKPKILCASVEALLSKLVFPEYIYSMTKNVKFGETVSLVKLMEFFVNAGYERVDMVEGKGQFSIRGGIVDFYPPAEEHAVRFELFGDEIDSIRYFDIMTQRSIEKINSVSITPVKELLIKKEDLKKAGARLKAELTKRVKQLLIH